MTRPFPTVVPLVLLAFAACAGGGSPNTTKDAGVVVDTIDAGSGVDAGSSVDAGSGVDAGDDQGPGPVDAARSTVTLDAGSAVADGVDAITITIALVDADGRPVADRAVTLATTGAATVSAAAATEANGTTTARWSSTNVETDTLTVRVGDVELAAHPTAQFEAGAARKLAFVVQPSATQADALIRPAVQVEVEDAQGHRVTTDTSAVTVSDADGALGGTSTVDAVDGIATFDDLLVTRAATGQTLTATDGALTPATSAPFDVSTGTLAKVVFVVGPTSTPVGAAMTPPVQVALEDAAGHVIPTATDAVTIYFGANPVDGTLSGTTTTNAVGGVATFADLSIDKVAAGYTLFAATQDAESDASEPFDVVPGAPSATTSTFAVPAPPVEADGTSVATLAVTVADAGGDRVADQLVSFAASGTGNAFSATTCTTGTQGDCSVGLASSVAETKSVTATFAGVTLFATVTFAAAGPNAARSQVTVSPSSLVAGGAPATVAVKVVDVAGRPQANEPVTLSASGRENTLTPASGTTDDAGAFSATVASTLAQTETVTAHVGEAGSNVDVTSDAITFLPGAPDASASTVDVEPNPMTDDRPATVTVTLRDANGNAVPDVAVSLFVDGDAGTITPPSGTTGEDGTFVASFASTTLQTVTINAVAGDGLVVLDSEPVLVGVGAPSSGTSTLRGPGGSVLADGVATATLVVTVEDSAGDVVPNQDVSFAASGSGTGFDPATCTTDETGECSVTLASTTAETKTVTATFGEAEATTQVTFVAGTPDAAGSSIVVSPRTVAAGTDGTTVSVDVVDAHGNAVAGVPVALTASGSFDTLSPTSGTTDDTGVFSAKLASPIAEEKQVTASVGATTPFELTSQTIAFVAAAASPALSSVVVPATVEVDEPATIRVTALDVNDNVLANVPVTLSASGDFNTFTPASGTTDASGAFVATLTSTLVEIETVTATVGDGDGVPLTSTPIAFTPGEPSVANSSATVSSTSLVAGESATITVTVKDAEGNVVPGLTLPLSASGTGNTFTPASGTTDSDGVFVASFSSTKAQTESFATHQPGSTRFVLTTAPVTVAPAAASAADSMIALTGNPLSDDGATEALVVVTAADSFGNGVGGATVALSASPAGGLTMAPTAQTTDASGRAYYALTASTPGSHALTATVNGDPIPMTATLEAVAPLFDAPVAVVKISGALAGCTTAYSNTSRKVALDAGEAIYVVMNCGGTADVAVSKDGGHTFAAPVSTGIGGVTGMNEVQVAGGAAGVAYVVGYSGASTVLFSRTADAGSTWSAPTTVTTTGYAPYGVAYPSLAVRGSTVWVAALGSTGTQVYRNDTAGEGAFPLVGTTPLAFPQATFWRLFVDPASGTLYEATEDNDLFVTSSADLGATWNPVLSVGDFEGARTSWALGGGYLYEGGSNAHAARFALADVDAAEAAASSVPVSATPLTGAQSVAEQAVAVDADSFGDAYLVTATAAGEVDLQVVTPHETSFGEYTKVAASGGSFPVVQAGHKGGALVAYTQAGAVYASVARPGFETTTGVAITKAAAPTKVSGALADCTTGSSTDGQQLGVDVGSDVVYAVMNCGGSAYVATSVDGGASFGVPVDVGLVGVDPAADNLAIAVGIGTAWVAAYTSANTIMFTRTVDGGVTWSRPVQVGSGASIDANGRGLVSVAARDADVWVAYESEAGTQVFENTHGGDGAFTLVGKASMAQTDALDWRVLVDAGSGHLFDVGGDGQLFAAASVDGGGTWGSSMPIIGATQRASAWAIGGGSLYDVGSSDLAYRVAAADVAPNGTGVAAKSIPGVVAAPAGETAVAVDSAGDAFVATASAAGEVRVQPILASSSLVGPPVTVVASGGARPAVLAGEAGSGAALVLYTQNGAVYASVVVAADDLTSCAAPTPDDCDGACTDTKNDAANCGACGHSCGIGGTCSNGECACLTCGGGCVDASSDPNNCGGCGVVCPAANPTCSGGQCGCGTGGLQCSNTAICADPYGVASCGCADGQLMCGGSCEAEGHPDCGTCGVACPTMGPPGTPTNCVESGPGRWSCAFVGSPRCNPGASACGRTCVYLDRDPANCGACGVTCGDGSICSSGHCVCRSVGGVMCDTGATSTTSCRALGETDPNACAPGASCYCGGDLDTNQDCGCCGHACPGGYACEQGFCRPQ